MKKVIDIFVGIVFIALMAWAMLYCGGIVPAFIFGD